MSTYLSAGELAQLRADALATLADDTCIILTPTTSVNAIGERVIAWGTVATAVACRLRPSGLGQNSQPIAGQQKTVGPWTVTLPHTSSIKPGDRLVIDTYTYEVAQSWDEETWQTACKVDVTRIE